MLAGLVVVAVHDFAAQRAATHAFGEHLPLLQLREAGRTLSHGLCFRNRRAEDDSSIGLVAKMIPIATGIIFATAPIGNSFWDLGDALENHSGFFCGEQNLLGENN